MSDHVHGSDEPLLTDRVELGALILETLGDTPGMRAGVYTPPPRVIVHPNHPIGHEHWFPIYGHRMTRWERLIRAVRAKWRRWVSLARPGRHSTRRDELPDDVTARVMWGHPESRGPRE